MPINEWKGDAPEVSELLTVTVTSAISGAVYRPFPTLGVQYTANSSDTASTIAAQLATKLREQRIWNNVTQSGAVITLTGPAGSPTGYAFSSALTAAPTPASYVSRVQAGVLAIAQQTLVTLPDSTTGGTWSLTADFGSGEETASSLAWNITPAALVTALEGLTTPGSGDVAVELGNSTREYRISWQGALAGTDVTVTASGAGLTGNATTERVQVQTVGENANEVQACWISSNSSPTWQLYFESAPGTVAAVSGLSAAALKAAVVDLTDLPETDVSVITQATANGTLAVFKLTGTAQGLSWDTLRMRSTVFGSEVINTFRLQRADAGAQDEIQFLVDGGTVPSSTSTREYTEVVSAASTVQGYFTKWIGSDSGTNAALQADHIAIQDGAPPVNETWTFGHNATGGTFTITYDGQTTSSVAYNASAATLKTALEALSNIGSGDVGVTGDGSLANPWRVEFKGALADTDVANPTWTTTSLTGGKSITVATTREAVPGVNEIQQLVIDRDATSGNLRLEFEGDTTASTAYNASASTWDTNLEALTTIGSGNVTVSGSAPVFLIEFTGSLAAAPQELLTVQDSGLTIAQQSILRTEVTTYPTGSGWWSNPGNWTLNRVPHTSDEVILQDSDVDIVFGLLQQVDVSIADNADAFTCGDHDFVLGQIVRVTLDDYSCELNGSPATVTSSTNLYVVGVSPNSIQVSTSASGNPLVWTDPATGTLGVQLSRLICRGSAGIGLPRIRSTGTWETFPRYLSIGFLSSTEELPALEILSSAGLIAIDAGASPLRCRVLDSGTSPGVLLLVDDGTNARLDVLEGTVGVALAPDEAAELLSIRCTGGTVSLGEVTYSTLLTHPPGLVESIRTTGGVTSRR